MSELHEQIRALRAKYPEASRKDIAALAGCAPSTVTKALNPEKLRVWLATDNAKRSADKQEWQKKFDRSPEGRGRCTECGGPLGIGSGRKYTGVCWDCVEQRVERRLARIEQLYKDGLTLSAIAAELGYPHRCYIARDTDRLRKAGRIGYRYRVENGKRLAA